VRSESLDLDRTVAIRGGPDTTEKLRRHAERTRRAFVLDGAPILGVSVFCALDEVGPASLDGLLAQRLHTYRIVHTPRAIDLVAAGFSLLPTFGRPHYTLTMTDISDATMQELVQALGTPAENPYHRGGRPGR
jgi:hypothetical protein